MFYNNLVKLYTIRWLTTNSTIEWLSQIFYVTKVFYFILV